MNPSKQALSFVDEFKNFALKGNVIDLAVGVIIGTAFGNLVKSLVEKIIMPLVSIVMPSAHGYTDWVAEVAGKKIPYGLFLGEVVNFIILALVLFILIVKFLGLILKSKKEEAAAPPPPTKDQELLTEIRDLLKSQR